MQYLEVNEEVLKVDVPNIVGQVTNFTQMDVIEKVPAPQVQYLEVIKDMTEVVARNVVEHEVNRQVPKFARRMPRP